MEPGPITDEDDIDHVGADRTDDTEVTSDDEGDVDGEKADDERPLDGVLIDLTEDDEATMTSTDADPVPEVTSRARFTHFAHRTSTGVVGLSRRYRQHKPVGRPTPAVLRVVTAIDLVAARSVHRASTVTVGLLDESSRSVERGEVGRALRLLAGARASTVDDLDRPELVEAARSLSEDLAGIDDELATSLGHEADRADGGRGQLTPIRAVVRHALRVLGADQAAASDEAAATAATVLGAARFGLVLVVLGSVAAWSGVIDAGAGDALRNLANYAAVVAWSAIGVTLSLVIPFGRERAGTAADHLRPSTELGVRMVLGITFALALVVVLQSGVQEALDLNETKAYPFAIAAGFSERLLDRRFRGPGDGSGPRPPRL